MITVVKSGKIGSKAEVYHGTKEYTNGGLRKKDIIRIKDKQGNYRYKSRKQLKKGKKNSFIKKWSKAVKRARKELLKEGIIHKDDFVPVGGSTRQGKMLLKRTRAIINGS
jgi:hypothetical protein